MVLHYGLDYLAARYPLIRLLDHLVQRPLGVRVFRIIFYGNYSVGKHMSFLSNKLSLLPAQSSYKILSFQLFVRVTPKDNITHFSPGGISLTL